MQDNTPGFTIAELREMLSHPDAHVRSYADWALEGRGAGWRRGYNSGQGIAQYRIEDGLRRRLEDLARLNLIASDKYILESN